MAKVSYWNRTTTKKGHVKIRKRKKRLHGVKLVFRMFHNEKEFLLVCCSPGFILLTFYLFIPI